VNLAAVPLTARPSRRGRLYLRGEHAGREYLVTRHDGYTYALSVPATESSWRVWLPLAALLVVLVLLYQATRLLFRPIAEIQAGVERIGAGELEHRLDVRRRDELGDLAASINAMAGQIRRMLEAKRQLLLAISHELRSPLTRAKVAAALLEDPAQRTEIARDLDELERLIEELLEIERLSGPHRALERRAVALEALIEETLASFFPGVEVRRRFPAPNIEAEVDVPRMKLLLKNLLENALRHTPQGHAPPEVALERTRDEIVLAVRDHGSGIAPEHLPHVTEPFYRADPARRRDTGGYGLGLYLCRVIAEAHGGRVAIESRVGEGTTVRVTLPATAP
jgi:signal transduction histidine kinase